MIVDIPDLPRHIILDEGERIVFPLPSYSNSGNTWSTTCLGAQGVASVTIELGEISQALITPGNGISEPPPLSIAPEKLIVHGLSCGETTWQLVLSRSFGGSQPTLSYNVHITVR
ncbi:MAG: hypothetical protein WCK32_08770 [Chlorobiaceae bacterium]